MIQSELVKALRQLVEDLRSGNPSEILQADLSLSVYRHPTLPLVGFKYSQIDSPKTHPIVQEARGIVLEEGTWNIVAKGFNRFFNVGEAVEQTSSFDWDNYSCETKEDGSLILLYHYAGEWHVNTSGSFGLQDAGSSKKSWRELFWETSQIKTEDLKGLEDQTIVFELCTPHNQVVRRYLTPVVYLLTSFRVKGDSFAEGSYRDVALIYNTLMKRNVRRPEGFQFNTKEDFKKLEAYLKEREESDPTFEGVVLKDGNGRRLKLKTATYVALHHMKDNGNILLPKRLVPIVLAGETDEVIATMPEVKTALLDTKRIIDEAFEDLVSTWLSSKDLPTQKEYALAVKGKPLNGVLFAMRKAHPKGTVEDLKALWRGAADFIVKAFFADKTYEFDVLEEAAL